jgi:hypothetical protein
MDTNTNIFNKMTNKSSILVLLIFAAHLLIMWPGSLNPDSQAQYNMAVAGMYNDHHPAIMSLVWRYLNYIIPGSGMMFLLQLVLFYGGIFYPSGLKYVNEHLKHPTVCFLVSLGLWIVMPNLFTVVLSLGYLIFGIVAWSKMGRQNLFAMPLVFCNLIGLVMLAVLLFFCMAATSRFTLINMCMVHISHVFCYLTYKHYRQFKLVAGNVERVNLDSSAAVNTV